MDTNTKAMDFLDTDDDYDSFSLPHPDGTVFDIYARDLLVEEPSFPETAESRIHNRTIYNMLEKAGGEFTNPVKRLEEKHPFYWCDYFAVEIQELLTFPEMIDCMFSYILLSLG